MNEKIELPSDLNTRAEWWCALNWYEVMPGMPPLSEGERSVLYEALTQLPGVKRAGLSLSRQRSNAGCYPQNGRLRE